MDIKRIFKKAGGSRISVCSALLLLGANRALAQDIDPQTETELKTAEGLAIYTARVVIDQLTDATVGKSEGILWTTQ